MSKQQISLFPKERETQIPIKLEKEKPVPIQLEKETKIIIRKDVKLKGIQKLIEKKYNLYSTFELYEIYLIEVKVTLNKRFERKVEIVYKKINKKIEEDKEALGRIKRELHTSRTCGIKIISIKKLKFLGYGVKE